MTNLLTCPHCGGDQFKQERQITYDESYVITFGADGYPEEDLLDDREVSAQSTDDPIRCSNCEYRFVDDLGDPVVPGEELIRALASNNVPTNQPID